MKLSEKLEQWLDLVRAQEGGKELQFQAPEVTSRGDRHMIWIHDEITDQTPVYPDRWRVKPEPLEVWMVGDDVRPGVSCPAFDSPDAAAGYAMKVRDSSTGNLSLRIVHLREVTE